MGNGRILVVDDEEMIRMLATEMLLNLGYDVEAVNDGIAAIELCMEAKQNGNSFDAIIMDLKIPMGMGGKEAVVEIARIDPRIKKIVSSGYSNDSIMANYEKYGFNGVIAKPYRIGELSQKLHELLNGSQS